MFLDRNRDSLQTSSLGEWSIEDLTHLFEGPILSFNVEEEDETSLEEIPGDVEEVELPFNVSETDRGDVLIKERCNVYPAVLG